MPVINRLLNICIAVICTTLFFTSCSSKGDDAIVDQTPQPVPASGPTRRTFLNDKQVVSAAPVISSATGTAMIILDESIGKLAGSVTISNGANAVTAVHINDADAGSSNGAPVVSLIELPAGSGTWVVPASASALTATQADRFKAAGFAVMADTLANPDGEIRGQLLSYADNIQKIFQTDCITCHNAASRAGFTGLDLLPTDSYANLVNKPATQSTGVRAVPFDAANSVLLQRITGAGFSALVGPVMPPPPGPVRPVPSARDVNLLRAWINMGAMDDSGAVQSPQQAPFRQYARNAFLNAAQIVSAASVSSSATGTAAVLLDTATRRLSGTIAVSNMTNAVTAVHINDGDAGSDGAPVVSLSETSPGSGVWTVPDASAALSDVQMNRFISAGFYVTVDTTANPGGEIRGQLMSYAANVQSLFSGRCVTCHDRGATAVFTGLLLGPNDSYGLLVNQLATQSTGTRVIPFDAANSVLYGRITGIGFPLDGQRMPVDQGPDGPFFTPREENIVKTWINMGAPND